MMFKQQNLRTSVKAVLMAGAMLALPGCTNMIDKHVEWETVKPEVFPIIKAVGYAPISLQKGASDSQKMILAIRSSKLDA